MSERETKRLRSRHLVFAAILTSKPSAKQTREREARVCECSQGERETKRLGSRHLVFAAILTSKPSAKQTVSRWCGFASGTIKLVKYKG